MDQKNYPEDMLRAALLSQCAAAGWLWEISYEQQVYEDSVE